MKDRVKIGNGKSSKVMCPSTYSPADFATFLRNLQAGSVYLDITANNSDGADAGVSEIGTALNKANMLSDALATKLGYQATDNPTPNDALDVIVDKIAKFITTSTVTIASTDWQTGTNTSGDTYYYCTKSVTGITASSQNIIGVSLANPAVSDSKTTRDNAVAGYSDFIYDGWYECGSGTITFKTYVKPEYAFSLVIVGG